MLLPTTKEMALLFLKQAFFGRSRHADYAPIAQRSSSRDDPERGLYGTTDTTTGYPDRDSLAKGNASHHSSASLSSSSPSASGSTAVAGAARSSLASCKINPRTISDATIGLSDGLTVPFALTAGLSALGDTNVVIYGGLAELIAGGISMGLGGYLGAKSEAEAYRAALAETTEIVEHDQMQATAMVRAAFAPYDLGDKVLVEMTESLLLRPDRLVDFLMRFHHQLAEADYAPSRAYVSGLTISGGYFFGGLVPLVPYFFVHSVHDGFLASVIVMAVALFVFGWLKTSLVGEGNTWTCFTNGLQMIVLGGVAAGAAMGCVKAIGT